MNHHGAFNILLSSAGRRVALLNLLKEALRGLGLQGSVFAADASPLAAAWRTADDRWIVPRCDSPEFLPAMLRICSEQRVRLLVPTIDTELPVFAEHRLEFEKIGTTVLVSTPEAVALAGDKVKTHEWLVAHGFPTVRQDAVAVVLANPAEWPLPLIAKPRNGSASIGVYRVSDHRVLEQLACCDDYVVQSVAEGEEYTVDVLLTSSGTVSCAVPRRRIEVRAGEISKGITVRSPPLQNLATALCERMPGAYGPMNVQIFQSDDGRLAVVEINARFGGGFPLSAHAGADFPRWIIQELCGLPSQANPNTWRGGVGMLRFDEAVFFESSEARST